MRRQRAAFARRGEIHPAMKNTIPSITIGLDLGDKKHAVCVLNAEGEIIDERTITNHRESLRRLSQSYSGERIAPVAGPHGS
jgi:hypothetical protein